MRIQRCAGGAPGQDAVDDLQRNHRRAALAAGGPLIHPTVRVIVLTPICPHTLNVRSLIIGEEEQARVVVTVDNGLMHLAVAVGARTVALFGASPRLIWTPPVPHLTILRLKPWKIRVR